MNIVNCIQGSPEWFESRIGHVTASRLADVLCKRKDGAESATRRNYRIELASQEFTRRMENKYLSPEMEWGIENEPLARTAYELERDVTVELTGFVLHPTVDRAGASPDGIVGTDGLLEIKCPKTATHLEYILSDEVPEEYQPQMQWQMACTGMKWCDFVSFDPRLESDFQLYVKRLPRDDKLIAGYELEVVQFLKEVDQLVERIHKLMLKPEKALSAHASLYVTSQDVATV